MWGAFISLISVWFFKWPGRPIIEEAEGDYDCVANLVAWKLPAGEVGNIAVLRIQTAAEGVNSFILQFYDQRNPLDV